MNQIEELIAREAIRQTKARYCRLLDTKQWSQWGDVFTVDAVMDVSDDVKGIPGASPTIVGRDVVVNQTKTLVGHARYVHQVHSVEIEFESESKAHVIWAMDDYVIFPDDGPAPFKSKQGYGHYHEVYVKQDNVWRIARLKLTRLPLDTITPRK